MNELQKLETQKPAEVESKSEKSTKAFMPKDVPSHEEIKKILPEILTSGGWEKCWVEEVTPWDLGCPTPIVVRLCQTYSLPKGRGLVPGCGSGYDVVTMANHDRFVIGLDISEIAVKKAIEKFASFPNANSFDFIKEDFFSWRPREPFDFIFDYLFFCAIKPEMRPAWAKSMNELLKPDGELITLMWPIGEQHDGGPPYKVSVADYEEVLVQLGFKVVSIEDNELAVGPRKGREKLGRWKKCLQ